jgi:hypothetical protein
MAKRIPKYGMPFHTIKYWQERALTLYRTNGIYAGRSTFESKRSLQDYPARTIGHDIISLAAVASPEHLKAVLTGTRGRRWPV